MTVKELKSLLKNFNDYQEVFINTGGDQLHKINDVEDNTIYKITDDVVVLETEEAVESEEACIINI